MRKKEKSLVDDISLFVDKSKREMFSELISIYNSVPPKVKFQKFEQWLRSKQSSGIVIPLKNRSSLDPGVVSYSYNIDFSNPGLVEQWISEFKIYPLLYNFLLKAGYNLLTAQEQLDTFGMARIYLNAIKKAQLKEKYDQAYPSFVPMPAGFLIIYPGKIKFEAHFITKWFEQFSNDGYLQKFRVCKECENLFLAKRTDALYCSRKCANSFLQKSYLEDEGNRNRVNAQRRANYHRKKQLTIIKQSNNGTL